MNSKIILAIVSVLFLASCEKEKTVDEYLASAQTFQTNNQYNSAIIELKNAIKADPKHAEARVRLGKIQIETLNYDSALKELNKAISNGYSKDKLLVSFASIYQNTGQNERLINEIKPLNTLSNHETAQIYAMRGLAYLRTNQKDKAIEELTLAKEFDSNQANVRLAWGLYESSNNNVEQQIEWLTPLIKANNPEAWSQMGALHQAQNKNEEAESDFTQAINSRQFLSLDTLKRALVRIDLKKFKEASSDLEALKKAGITLPIIEHSEGVIAFQQDDLELAQTKFDSILRKYSSFPPSLLALGMTHFKKKNYANAQTNLEQYLAIEPKNSLARMTLATSLLETNQADKATNLLKQLNVEIPNNYDITLMLGTAYIANNDLDRGILELKKAIKLKPKNTDGYLRLAAALLSKNKSSLEAQSVLKEAIKIDPDSISANVSLYASYLETKQYKLAQKLVNELIKQRPDESLAYNLLANIDVVQNNTKKAIEIYKNTLKQFPKDSTTSINLAKIYVQQKEPQKAENLYKSVLEEKPGDIKALIPLAVLASREKRDVDTEQYLKEAIKHNEKVLSPKLLLSSKYLQDQKYNKAFNIFLESSKEDQEKPEVLLVKARAKMGMKEYKHALNFLKKLTKLRPDATAGHFLMAQTYGALNRKNLMKSSLKRTLDINPKHFSASLILARIALTDNDKKEFAKRLASLKKEFPDNPDVIFLEAKSDSKNQDYSGALSTLESLLESTPHTDVVLDIARNKWNSGDKDGAIAGIELWLSENSDDKEAIFMLAQLFMEEKSYENARIRYEELNNLSPTNPVVLNNLAWLYKEIDPAIGVKYAKSALELAPKSPFIMDTVADLLLLNNKASEALGYSSQAAKEQPNFFEIQLNYAKVLIANGRQIKAESILKKTKKLAKTEEEKSLLKAVEITL